MSNLSTVWPSIESLLAKGISIIPVRDKDDGVFKAKTPFKEWKKYQNQIIDIDYLFAEMDTRDTSAIAAICGAISGNLEIIDVDEKYNPGISATLFSHIKSIYPDLFDKLLIHKSPSGGYHIIYRISNPADGIVPGNQKLAGRYTTEEEKAAFRKANPLSKRVPQEVNFIETRGEGGYTLMPPSMGYSVHQTNDIPILSWAERCDLINICKGLSEIVKVKPEFKQTKSESNFYDENPFEDFNKRCDPIALMDQFGWKPINKQSPRFVWFTRPQKDSGISASYNKEKGVFFVFTSSTELEPEKGYLPSTMLAELMFNGDKKKTFSHLTKNGYGKINRRVESNIVKTKAVKNEPLPPNLSDDARLEYAALVNQLQETYPYGIYWDEDDEGKISINREKLYRVCHALGYRNSKLGLCKIEGNIVSLVMDNEFFNEIKDYIKEEDANLYDDICNAYESFIQRAGSFTISRLDKLNEDLMIKDDRDICYKFFSNCFIEITSTSISEIGYEHADGLIWKHKIQDRLWLPEDKRGNLYRTFLSNATGDQAGGIPMHVKKVIGYLSHDFKEANAGYIIVLTEKVPDPKKGGGSGKNIFGNILSSTTTIKTVPGAAVKFDDRFMNAWDFQRIFFLADIEKRIDWAFLKEIATGEGYVNKKYKGEFTVSVEDMPKILINTNYSFDDVDGGLKRRIIAVEFNEFYTINKGVDSVHGKLFPKDFNEADWCDFDYTIAECIQQTLKTGGKLEPTELSDTGWDKKFIMNHNETTFEFIKDHFDNWLFKGFVSNDDFKRQYIDFANLMDVPDKYRLSSEKMNVALKEYCDRHEIEFNKKSRNKINSVLIRGRSFYKKGTKPPDEQEEFPF